MPVSRFVAIGDSMTEGLNDGDDSGGYRGWADRLAVDLAVANPEVRYANLALRGLCAGDIRAAQLARALELKPDLVTVVAGVNDLIRIKFDANVVGREIEAMFEALNASGAHVVTLLLPDVSRLIPLARPLRKRIMSFNRRIEQAARRHDVTIVDGSTYPFMYDPRTWSADRLHATPLGHRRIAAAVAETLGVAHAGDELSVRLPAPPQQGVLRRAAVETRWLVSFFVPWLRRRFTGRSSGDGRTAKHWDLVPVEVRSD